jgi:hypothetical protein
MEVELQTAVDHDGASSSKSRRGLPAPERLGTNQNRTTERAPGQPSRPEILFPAESNCAGVNEGKEFASFAGEWTCIAVLLDRPDANVPYAPKFVGLTNRNIGKIQVAGREERITMRVRPWSAMQLLGNTHPRFEVAKGSHAYFSPGAATF